MRELTLRIRFTTPCLGNQKLRDCSGKFVFQRNPTTGHVMFLPTWHHANTKWAAQLLGRYQDEVGKIHWDPLVDGQVRQDPWYRRYYNKKASARKRYVIHEAFFPKQEVGINLCLPDKIPEEEFVRLMSKAGQFRGISPWTHGDFGNFEVVSIRTIRMPERPDTEEQSQQERVGGSKARQST